VATGGGGGGDACLHDLDLDLDDAPRGRWGDDRPKVARRGASCGASSSSSSSTRSRASRSRREDGVRGGGGGGIMALGRLLSALDTGASATPRNRARALPVPLLTLFSRLKPLPCLWVGRSGSNGRRRWRLAQLKPGPTDGSWAPPGHVRAHAGVFCFVHVG